MITKLYKRSKILKIYNNINIIKHKMSLNLSDLRHAYKSESEAFLEDQIKIKDPINLFKIWFEEVRNEKKIIEPNAVCLATSDKNGAPSARFVLLKGYNKEGFSFFTHYNSRKGKELEENPQAALTFYWDVYNRSVRIEGSVRKLPLDLADEYFHSRPKVSQIGVLASVQSRPVAGRSVLEQKYNELKEKYSAENAQVPRPELWGGYILQPNVIEFWQGQTNRLHDRIRFRKPKTGETVDNILLHQGEDGWAYERLCP